MNNTWSITLIIALIVSFFSTISSAKNFAGENIPEDMQYAGKKLQLNGVGQRSKLFMNLYIGALYLESKSQDGKKIITDDAPMAIRLAITSPLITTDKMKEATIEGFKNSTKGNINPIKPQIDELLATFDKGVSSGDVFELINTPGSGVHVIRNGVRVTVIRSLAFKQALFGIWLSKKPVQNSLKRRMLGL
ncbi:MAG: FIG026291: Hypothetical periplasmic protein [uncultured Thiotrichaceae bacterium]|uniref:FIG026291: Hypothetical periplasmic protein n=1 Tax=uncultured Thiotrichaceae bacterium TaxID=298394 RepID=A0A6S6S863_9GAMM|nr:MAG: FIG026291: Hypothetical periplasmic protein [uncultured Thiotrichaceae bacterium]